MPSSPELSVVVPATNQPPTLDRCLSALRSGESPPAELLVVDQPPDSGPAAARNAGAGRARGEILVFVDADVEVHGDALALMARHFDEDPELAAVFGAYDDRPPGTSLVSRFRNLLHHHVHTSAEGPAETFWAGLGAVRATDFERVGGFDASRFAKPSVEDIELGMRLRAAGARVRLDPGIRGRHLKRWTLGSMLHTDFARRGVPWVRLQVEDGRVARGLNLSPRHRLSALCSLALVAALIGRRPRAAAVAALAQLALNADFYALLARRGGLPLLAVGPPLLVTHELVAVASVPVGIGAALASARPQGGVE